MIVWLTKIFPKGDGIFYFLFVVEVLLLLFFFQEICSVIFIFWVELSVGLVPLSLAPIGDRKKESITNMVHNEDSKAIMRCL